MKFTSLYSCSIILHKFIHHFNYLLIRKNNSPSPESKNCRTKCAAVPSGFTGSVFSYLAKARNFLFLFN